MDNKEKELVRLYTGLLEREGLSGHEAKKMAKLYYREALEMSIEEGTCCFPTNMGDLILGDAAIDDPEVSDLVEQVKILRLPKIRREGVRDEGIRAWWNMNDIERQIAVVSDNHARKQTFMMALEETIEPDADRASALAAEAVRKIHAMYGDPDDTSQTQGDDRPLPYELKDRVNVYALRRATTDQEQFKADIESSSSFNALVHREIRAGRL